MAAKIKKQATGEIRGISENRKARHEYDISERVEAGLVLTGSEVKALRGGKGNIAEAFVRFEKGEAWLVDAHIAEYVQAGPFNHEPRRRRKLLMKGSELDRLAKKVQEKGLTVVPLKLFFKGSWVKLEVGLAKGRKLYDKRNAIKEREGKREAQRALRQRD